ncbi:hypothetical protein LJ707_06490 [Mucilaginibacter sp. UR6-1]|uniref:hypothetical protein n=1 Tax=Mucilaginibacter sp. UR6-1 TaxID=1435643 RepID=UPI001E6569BB|nr:hypothetical protein [Mucilaginibacter sp. UR6-1]MCC8408570.1 hypothetical protein [Mucilaginibacter sp. UR6-1]
MHNRFAYIFISVVCWFSIAIVLPISGALIKNQYVATSSYKYNNDRISADNVSTVCNDDASESTNQKRLVARFRVRFLLNRSVELNAILQSGGAIPGFVSAHIKHLFTRYFVRKASLPGYYSFLFRLSPF